MAKYRLGFVTNSSSSSFIITNKSGETLTSKEIIMKLFEGIIEDADDRFILEPGYSVLIECGDHPDDGLFENFIHDTFGGWSNEQLYENEYVEIEFDESHH